MHFVYLIRSITYPDQKYVGYTTDVTERLAYHNASGSPHTSNFIPWKLVSYIAFDTKEKAQEFERYLKSGSGRAFAEKRLW